MGKKHYIYDIKTNKNFLFQNVFHTIWKFHFENLFQKFYFGKFCPAYIILELIIRK